MCRHVFGNVFETQAVYNMQLKPSDLSSNPAYFYTAKGEDCFSSSGHVRRYLSTLQG